MKKNNTILSAALLCLALTACGNNAAPETADNTADIPSEAVSSSESALSSETTEAETTTETSAEETTEETTSESETTAEETTTVTETTPEAAETTEDGKLISPGGWVLDRTVDIAAEGHRDVETDIPFFICELSNGDRIYGVNTTEEAPDSSGTDVYAQYTMIEHDGIVDEFRRDCFGRFGADSPLECELSDLDSDGDEEIYTTLYVNGGTFCLVMDMAVFDKNEDGHYEMLTISDNYSNFSPEEAALADEILSRINIEWCDDNESVRLSTDTSEYFVELAETPFFGVTAEELKEKLYYPESIKNYGIKNDTIYMELNPAFSDDNSPFPCTICGAKGQLIYSDGKFTLGNVDLAEFREGE